MSFVLDDGQLPDHAYKWACKLYEARQQGKPGIVVEAHRGSSKTTTFSIGWLSFQLGLYPERSNLVVGLNDTAANEITGAIETIITESEGFKTCFPYVEPNPSRGWGAHGYYVRRSDITPQGWARKTSMLKDPSMLALGIFSSQLTGKHPTGAMIADDLHDADQVKSEAELARVHNQVSAALDKALDQNPTEIWIGTPYHEDDAIQRRKAMGIYEVVQTPLYEEVEENDGAVFDEDIQKYIVINWPEEKSLEYVQQTRARDKITSGGEDFNKHMLLDLTAASTRLIKFSRFPADLVDPSWKKVFTVDFASVLAGKVTRYSDHLAICVAAKKPQGGLVIIGGARRHATQSEAQSLLQSLNTTYEPTIIGIESVGKGQLFFDMMWQLGLPVMELKPRGRRKVDRIERQLQPFTEVGAITVINDDSNEFVRGLLSEAIVYPNGRYDDALDAAAYLPEVASDALTATGLALPGIRRRQKVKHSKGPWAMVGGKHHELSGKQQVGYSNDFKLD